MQSDVKGQENPGQASGDRLHFPGSTRNSQVTESGTSDVEGYYWMPKSSSGRNGSQNPNAQASGDRLQSKEDHGLRNMLSLGVKLSPIWVTRISENLQKTFGKLNLSNFSKSTLQRGVFSHVIASGHHSKSADQSKLAPEVVLIIISRRRRTY